MTEPSVFNPIVRREEIQGWNPFAARPRPEPGMAVVLIRNGQPALALTADDQLTWSRVAWSNYQWAFWVDTGEQAYTLQCALPSQEQGLDFQAVAHITYKVNDPLMVIRRRITDARAFVEPVFIRLLRRVTRQFTLGQCSAAEQAIARMVKANLRQGIIAITRCITTLDLEEDERNHARTMRASERHYLHSHQSITYSQQIDDLEVPLSQKQIDFYKQIATSDASQILWLYLANHRDEIHTVLRALYEQRQLEREHWLRMLKELRDADGVEPQHLEHLRKSVLERLAELDMQIKAALPSGAVGGSASQAAPNTASAGGAAGNVPPTSTPAVSSAQSGASSSSAPSAAPPSAVPTPAMTPIGNPASQPGAQAQPPLKERELGGKP
jgi:hypothetical protein